MINHAVTYNQTGNIATVSLDSGKANPITFDVISGIHTALDMAQEKGTGAVVLHGPPHYFTGGFDLAIVRAADQETIRLVVEGGNLCLRLYSSPRPIVAACTGHAVGVGALLLMSTHYRVGARGPFRIGLIETQIGLTMPDWGIELARQRIPKTHLQQAVVEARVYDADTALHAGFLDQVTEEAEVIETATAEAIRLASLPAHTYKANLMKLRGDSIDRMTNLVDTDRKAAEALSHAS